MRLIVITIAIQLSLLSILIQQESGSLLHIPLVDRLGLYAPRTTHTRTTLGQPLKIKLTTHLRIGPTRMRHVIAIEGHHMAEHVRLFGLRRRPMLTPLEFEL